ncbi:E3.2.1.14 [Acanthosepion pharaonis]|uniref:E3.2.1.14 n=1 Tax=Acanthosepion pharaonis TaxID=158019 RepID=A0A812BRD1_ACAPH|nr:E3.2.1.14 [Sepia pharaonis]
MSFSDIPQGTRVWCYYTNWAQYRPGDMKYTVKDMDISLCTHAAFAFAVMSKQNTIKAYEWNDEDTAFRKGMYSKFTSLKNQYPNLKTYLSVGGWNFGAAPFTWMASSSSNRTAFIKSTIPFLHKGSLLGDQTPFFLHLFSSRSPGNYTFLLRPLKGENLLKHALKHFLKTHVFAPSSQTALAPNSTYGLNFNFTFWGFFERTFSEGEICPQQLCFPCILHLWANAACLFSRERENEPLLSKLSRFQLLLRYSPNSPFPFKAGGGGSPLNRPITVH